MRHQPAADHPVIGDRHVERVAHAEHHPGREHRGIAGNRDAAALTRPRRATRFRAASPTGRRRCPTCPAHMDPQELLPGPDPDAAALLGRVRAASSCSPTTCRWAPARSTPRRRCARSGPKPWKAAYVQPSRRPKDGRYGENPNRLQHYYQFQVILKPSPDNIQELYLQSLAAIGLDSSAARHPLRRGRLGKPDARRLGARLGMLVRRHGSQPVHLFPAGRRLRVQARAGRDHLRPRAPRHVCAGRRERLRPQFQRPRRRRQGHLWRRLPAERAGILEATISRPPTPTCCSATSPTPKTSARRCWKRAPRATATTLAVPAYEQVIKACHTFNLLDARGVISVTERQSYILRIRELAKACGDAWLQTAGGGAA